MSRALSGWQQRSYLLPSDIPDEPAGFEILLSDLGINEDQAIRNPVVRSWVRQNARMKYVPERVLKAFGVYVEA